MHCCVNSMRLLKPEIIAVFKTFLPARFLRNLLFLRVWKTPQNVVNGAKFLDDLIQKKKRRIYIFIFGRFGKKYLCSGSGTQLCNVIQDIFCQLNVLE